MTKKSYKKGALLSSIIALLLCCTMLIGTTFAWFTDSAASGSNVITAGNLDIEVQYTLDGETWADLDGATDLFQKDLWEPGHTEVVALKIENKGSLALKYAANMNIVSETVGKTKDGADIVLSDILTVSTLIQQADAIGDITVSLAFNGENKVGYESTAAFKDSNVLRSDKELLPGNAHYAIVKVDMAETVGNEANHNGTEIPEINFGLNVMATQLTYENDSFGNQYDKDADYENVAKTFDELKMLIAKGGNIALGSNIEVTGMVEIPTNGSASIDGQGYTLTRADSYTGTILSLGEYAELALSNITLDGENVESTGNLVYIDSYGKLILNNGAVLQNHVGGTTYDNDPYRGPENSVIHCDGETTIVMNDGSVIRNNVAKGNFATVIMSSYGVTCELNGGKIINNTSEKNNYTVWFGNYANITVSDGFEAHGNTDGGLMRVNQNTTFTMNGGKLDGNGKSAIYTWVAKYVTLNGGEIVGNVSLNYTPATVGGTNVNGVIYKDNEVTKWALNLTPSFGTVRYSIAGNITQLSIVPAEGYTYVAGDETKLICENTGYETYWDAESGCFKVQTSN